jgi:hypothetical protein
LYLIFCDINSEVLGYKNEPPADGEKEIIAGLPSRLIRASIITEEQAQEASREAAKMGISLVRCVVDVLDVDSQDVAAMASQELVRHSLT